MDSEIIYEQLDQSVDDEKNRDNLIKYISAQIAFRKTHKEKSRQIAYDLAGLLSTSYVTSLKSNDPLLEILEMAGELELPEKHRGSATWQLLEQTLRELE